MCSWRGPGWLNQSSTRSGSRLSCSRHKPLLKVRIVMQRIVHHHCPLVGQFLPSLEALYRDDLDERRIASFIDVPSQIEFRLNELLPLPQSDDPVAAWGAPVA